MNHNVIHRSLACIDAELAQDQNRSALEGVPALAGVTVGLTTMATLAVATHDTYTTVETTPGTTPRETHTVPEEAVATEWAGTVATGLFTAMVSYYAVRSFILSRYAKMSEKK